MALQAAALIPLSLLGILAGSLPHRLQLVLSPDESCSPGEVLEAQVAQTPEERSTGLSHRNTPLGSTEGMLFVWSGEAAPHVYWMKDTFVPLTILFFDPSSHLLSTQDMPVETDPANPGNFYGEERGSWVELEIAGGQAARFAGSGTVLCVEP